MGQIARIAATAATLTATALAAWPAGAGALIFSAPELVDPGHAFTAVSCPSQRLCVAADDSGALVSSTDPIRPRARWTRTKRSGPALAGVACPSSRLCFAVADDGHTFVSTDPGAGRPTWHARPIGGLTRLEGIWCQAPGLCVAAAPARNGGTTLLVTRDRSGQRWRRGPVSKLPVTGAACPSVSLCVAGDSLGDVYASADPFGRRPRWRTASLNVNGLIGLACPAASSCLAIDGGASVFSSTDPTGGANAWKRTTVDRPGVVSGDGGNATQGLTGLACASASLCVATDGASGIVQSRRPAAGLGWRRTALGGRPGTSSMLAFDGITCQARFCVAVDTNGNVVVGAAHRVPVRTLQQCDARAAGASASGSLAVVYGLSGVLGDESYFACVRPAGRPVKLAYTSVPEDQYGSNTVSQGFLVSSTYAAAISQTGLQGVAQCDKYMQGPPPYYICPEPPDEITVVDAAARRTAHFATTASDVSDLTVSPAGAVAWLQNGGTELVATALTPSGASGLSGTPQVLATGAIDPGSLRFSQRTLSWSVGGAVSSQTLG